MIILKYAKISVRQKAVMTYTKKENIEWLFGTAKRKMNVRLIFAYLNLKKTC